VISHHFVVSPGPSSFSSLLQLPGILSFFGKAQLARILPIRKGKEMALAPHGANQRTPGRPDPGKTVTEKENPQ